MIRPFLQPVSKGHGRWYFSHWTAERCRREIRKWNLPQIRARRKKRYPGCQVSFLSCTFVERWASNLSTTTQPTAKPDASHGTMPLSPVLGGPPFRFRWWKKLFEWMEWTIMVVGCPTVLFLWNVCGGNLLIGFSSGFLNMWPRKPGWHWCIVKIRRKGRSYLTWLKTLSLQTKASCMSIIML